ncbi:hypothetical protein BIS07_21640, partial [Halomonas sp. FL8]|uniref:hypothetical protein n=1 Tax=Halomonas sp. FL8 TaxID=1904461 RepID=UPI00209FECB3
SYIIEINPLPTIRNIDISGYHQSPITKRISKIGFVLFPREGRLQHTTHKAILKPTIVKDWLSSA